MARDCFRADFPLDDPSSEVDFRGDSGSRLLSNLPTFFVVYILDLALSASSKVTEGSRSPPPVPYILDVAYFSFLPFTDATSTSILMMLIDSSLITAGEDLWLWLRESDYCEIDYRELPFCDN